MAQITRRSPDYRAKYTVVLRNGSGQRRHRRRGRPTARHPRREPAVADQRRQLRLPQTQIMAGRDALPVAQDIRAILGRGVVLDGADLPADDGRRHRRRRPEGNRPRAKGPAVALDADLQKARELAQAIAGFAADKKAQDIVVLEMGDAVSYTDFFVIVSGATIRQTKAIADGILEGLAATTPAGARRRASARPNGSSSTSSTWSCTSSRRRRVTSTASRPCGATCPA